ncbi:MFS transporter, sugar porter (SP) family [Metschnikowia aff. pulcherrima]|uniref:Quinate transporter n=1 Tax=Metschnikowia aff. pulcherrima TaxID=2163413 RepID=A0A4P6XRH2_9ASCO|nr:MFS transporter, sugar porter (SP) family [Metschnikowia aff. pulcherrima]
MKPTVSTSSKDSDGQSSEMDISPYIQDRKTTLQLLKDAVLLKSLFEKIEDRPTPLLVYNWRIYFTALISSAAAIIIGYDGGFIGGTVALESFLHEFGLDTMTEAHRDLITSNVISVFHAGCFFGLLISYPFLYYLGRKIPLIIAATSITIGSAIMLAANSSTGLGPIYAGRVIAGLAVGFSTNLTPVYLSEISPPAIRGRIIALYEIGWRIGDLVGFWINYGIDSHIPSSKKQWFIPFAVQLIPSGMFLAGAIIMRESPRWLLSVQRHDKAIENLTWFRKLPESDEYIIFEVNQVKESIESQRAKVGMGLFDPFREIFFSGDYKILHRMCITCTLFLFQNFLGIQLINYYSPKIFASLGVKGTNATLFSTGMFGVVKTVVTMIYVLVIVDSFGRRKAFMCSSVVCSVCFWYIGLYLKVNDPTQPGVEAGPGGTAAIVMMYVWIASFIAAWSGGPFVVGSEVFDQNIRSFVQAINSAVLWVPIFIMSRFTTLMIEKMRYGIYFFFASLAVLSIPFVFFCVPETKGIALEDMDKLFDRAIPARRAHKFVIQGARQDAQRAMVEHQDLFKVDTSKTNGIEQIEDIAMLEKLV